MIKIFRIMINCSLSRLRILFKILNQIKVVKIHQRMGVNLQKNIKIIMNQRLEEEVDKKDKSQQKKSVKIVLFKF